MIELLGIAMPASAGQWLFRRLSARVDSPELIAVVSHDRDARLALLDAVTARRIPTEGRRCRSRMPSTLPRILLSNAK